MKTTLTTCLLAAALACALAAIAAPATVAAQEPNIRSQDATSEEEWAYSVGVQNYILGLPLTIFERERKLRPEIQDLYWSVEVADCYTENLFYIGTRATGGKAGNHAFVGPHWEGKLPEGVIEHRVPYNSLMFALRIGVLSNDDADLKKVLGLQESGDAQQVSPSAQEGEVTKAVEHREFEQ